MNKILLVIKREFLTRVKKKSFIVMTILGPVFLAGFMLAPMLIMQIRDTEEKEMLVADQTGLFADRLHSTDLVKYTAVQFVPADSLKNRLLNGKSYALLYIEGKPNEEPVKVTIYSEKQLSVDIQGSTRRQLENVIEKKRLMGYNIENIDEILASLKVNINVATVRWDKDGGERESHTGALMGAAYVASFAIYMFIFMFGSMVMRGVIEEKSNRIVEVIISSIKPFQLMLGKILGIAMVGLLQFAIWILLTLGIVMAVGSMIAGDMQQVAAEQIEAVQQASGGLSSMLNTNSLSAMLSGIPFTSILISFLFYFLGGYLLYAALFAAIGSAVENEADTQQLVIPVTIPIIVGLFIMMHSFQYPDSSLSFWASMIPFTSPMVMMARVPFGVPMWELALSIAILFATFILLTWFTAKIYRVGILMYGKKPSLKEMMKWVSYKN
ncbi:MAG: ABC transporter permease [Prevotellaceae bacterium]|jgi:ABC-2 type transport system permease protein|nr:ABC transporter permease [Prevotellaceae bacterium]